MEAMRERSRARRWLLLLLMLSLSLPLGSCGDDGGECDRCSSDDDCTGELVCSRFDDGSTRCGTGMGTECTVR